MKEYEDKEKTITEEIKAITKVMPDDTPLLIKTRNGKIIYCKTGHQPIIDLCERKGLKVKQ